MTERLAFEQFHGDERPAANLIDFVDGANVGVIQCRSRARLSPKALEHKRILRELFGQAFDRHLAPEIDVLPSIDDSHTAAADYLQQPVMTNLCTDCKAPFCSRDRSRLFQTWCRIGCLERRCLNEGRGLFMMGSQRFDFSAKGFIARAQLLE